jgi:hypothetical protein
MEASKKQQKTKSTKFFQAIGLIYGRVVFDESQLSTVELDGEKFQLNHAKRSKKSLIDYLETLPDSMLYLRVYPRFNLETLELGFEVIGFDTKQPEPNHVNQFFLAGVWQYISRLTDQPVITIYRNSLRPEESRYRFENYHVPVKGFEEKPFLYKSENPEVASNKRKFYELTVNFNPQQKEFNFVKLHSSTQEIPKYIKRKFNKPKAKPHLKPTIEVLQMNFLVLKKTAMQLREAGFFEEKVSGKGVTKESLSTKIQDTLTKHPEAAKILK